VAKAEPEGYQFVLGSRADAINQTLYKNPLYNLATDLAPVILIAEQPMVLVTRKDLPVSNLQEFITHVRKNQANMQFGSAGTGSTGHIDCALLNAAMGVNVPHIPYRGGGPAMQDLIAGRFDYFCTLSATILPQIDSNLVKAIAIFSRERSRAMPNLPTADEQSFTDLEASTWFGFFFPSHTPPSIIERLHDATVETIETPSVQARLKESATAVVAPERRSPQYLQKFVASEIERNAGPIKVAGIAIE